MHLLNKKYVYTMYVGIFVRLLTYKVILEALDEDTEVNNENQELIAVADDIQKTLRRA